VLLQLLQLLQLLLHLVLQLLLLLPVLLVLLVPLLHHTLHLVNAHACKLPQQVAALAVHLLQREVRQALALDQGPSLQPPQAGAFALHLAPATHCGEASS
jgi:hypothetical protein